MYSKSRNGGKIGGEVWLLRVECVVGVLYNGLCVAHTHLSSMPPNSICKPLSRTQLSCLALYVKIFHLNL
jgi:hypothetical protein